MNRMLRQVVKTTLVLASSAVVIPYAVALIANVVYGWPQCKDKYRRAFNPRKVYALTFAALRELRKLRLVGLLWRWQRFYRSVGKEKVVKDIPFGSNDNFLDVYLAGPSEGGLEERRPVIIFIYGGTWGSGDKNMYGLLCSHLAEVLRAVVVCPNYSLFPKGFVDDMVQDIGEAIQWVKQHIRSFGGNKNDIILMGHSAGAHLAALTVLELCIKQLVHDEDSLLLSSEEVAEATAKGDNLEISFITLPSSSDGFHFDEGHFNGDGREKSGVSAKNRSVVIGCQGDASNVMESFYFVEKPEGQEAEVPAVSEDLPNSEGTGGGEGAEKREVEEERETGEKEGKTLSESFDDVSEQKRTSGDVDVKAEKHLEVTQTGEGGDDDDDDLLSSIRLVIGLAGVYDIAEHFEHEMANGIEDVSTMTRAMYDPRHFEQFSPTFLAKALPPNIRLPPMHLLHGDPDITVPCSSSVRFGEALWSRGIRSVQVVLLPGCGHIDMCLDMMEPGRCWHDILLTEVRRSVCTALAER